MENNSNQSLAILILILSALTAFAPLSVDMYLPSMPSLVKTFDTNEANVQLTLSSFLFGFAIAQLIHGPLSDRFGRKYIIIVGIILYIIASIGIILSSSIELIILFRFFQAFGGSAGPVMARAIVRDTFTKDRSSQILSILFLVMSSAPLLAPFIGSQILIHLGWRYIFIILIIFSIICLLLTIVKLPESLPKNLRTNINFLTVINNYIYLFKNKFFVGYMFCMSFGFAGMFAYITGSPFFIIDYYGFSPEIFGIFFFINVLFLIIGSVINTIFVRKIGSYKMLKVGCIISSVTGVAILINILFFYNIDFTILPLISIFMPSVTITGANATASALNLFPKNVGTAAAALGSVQFAIGGVSSYLVGVLNPISNFSMGIIIGVFGIMNIFSFIFFLRSDNPSI